MFSWPSNLASGDCGKCSCPPHGRHFGTIVFDFGAMCFACSLQVGTNPRNMHRQAFGAVEVFAKFGCPAISVNLEDRHISLANIFHVIACLVNNMFLLFGNICGTLQKCYSVFVFFYMTTWRFLLSFFSWRSKHVSWRFWLNLSVLEVLIWKLISKRQNLYWNNFAAQIIFS